MRPRFAGNPAGLRTALALAWYALLYLPGFAASPAQATLRLEFNPEDQTVPLGETGVLSVISEEPFEIRTIELWVDYDPELLASIRGVPGKRFVDSGCMLFPDFRDSLPGQWYGTVVTIGYDCWARGPGELYRWDFRTLQNGVSPILAAQVRLYDPLGEIIDDIHLPPARIVAGVGTDAPVLASALASLTIQPNPFNPQTRIRFRAEQGSSARLELFDLGGRRLGTLWEGWLDGAGAQVEWTGRDEKGRQLPSGVYFFRLSGEACGVQTRRGILLE